MSNTFADASVGSFGKDVRKILNDIGDLLVEKNKKYGDAALNPKRVFSKATPVEQLLVRIDDKLSRIATSGESAADEDTLTDLIGYLILLKIARRNQGGKTDSPKFASGGFVGGRFDSLPSLGSGVSSGHDYRSTINSASAGIIGNYPLRPKDIITRPMPDRPQA